MADSPVIAALYVETDGAYFGLDDVDPWDEARDARKYGGPWAVVAHPPCASWSIMGNCRPDTRAHGDSGCFEHALYCVRRFGGVLEHPAHTRAWKAFGLLRPAERGWSRSLYDDGWTCQIDQRLYGHGARKPTWLYVHGVDDPPAMLWGRGPAGVWKVADVSRAMGKRQSFAEVTAYRSRTPEPFRETLLSIARSALPSFDVLPRERAV